MNTYYKVKAAGVGLTLDELSERSGVTLSAISDMGKLRTWLKPGDAVAKIDDHTLGVAIEAAIERRQQELDDLAVDAVTAIAKSGGNVVFSKDPKTGRASARVSFYEGTSDFVAMEGNGRTKLDALNFIVHITEFMNATVRAGLFGVDEDGNAKHEPEYEAA